MSWVHPGIYDAFPKTMRRNSCMSWVHPGIYDAFPQTMRRKTATILTQQSPYLPVREK
jgi:hypothetical protein